MTLAGDLSPQGKLLGLWTFELPKVCCSVEVISQVTLNLINKYTVYLPNHVTTMHIVKGIYKRLCSLLVIPDIFLLDLQGHRCLCLVQ